MSTIFLFLHEFWNLAPVLRHSRRRSFPTTCVAQLQIDRPRRSLFD